MPNRSQRDLVSQRQQTLDTEGGQNENIWLLFYMANIRGVSDIQWVISSYEVSLPLLDNVETKLLRRRLPSSSFKAP